MVQKVYLTYNNVCIVASSSFPYIHFIFLLNFTSNPSLAHL